MKDHIFISVREEEKSRRISKLKRGVMLDTNTEPKREVIFALKYGTAWFRHISMEYMSMLYG